MGKVTYIVNGSDNRAAIVLYEGGAAKDMSGVTRVTVTVDNATGTVIDSDSITMTWDTAVTIDGEATYPIQFVGDDAGLATGTYRDCLVKVYDNANTDGIVWPDLVTLVVS